MSKPIRERAPQPGQFERGQQAEADRHRREAAALRENLARRKAQQRLRQPVATAEKTGRGAKTQD
jgi:hypothetical protein